jgi:hypothetical protein
MVGENLDSHKWGEHKYSGIWVLSCQKMKCNALMNNEYIRQKYLLLSKKWRLSVRIQKYFTKSRSKINKCKFIIVLWPPLRV